MSMFSACRLDLCILISNNNSPVAFRVCPNNVKSNESHGITQNHDISLSLSIGRIEILQKERRSAQNSLFTFALHERFSKRELETMKRRSLNVLKCTQNYRYLMIPLCDCEMRNFVRRQKLGYQGVLNPTPDRIFLTQTTKRFAYRLVVCAGRFVCN